MGYRQVHDRSLSDPEDFWSEAADAIDWERRWNNVLQSGEGPFDRWFAGGMLNTCHNALDRHVDGGRGEQIALIHDSPVTDTIERILFTWTSEAPWSSAKDATASTAWGAGESAAVTSSRDIH